MLPVLKAILMKCLVCVSAATAGAGSVNQMQGMAPCFTQNQGQWPDSILFRADAGGAVMWFVRDGVYCQFMRRVERADRAEDSSRLTDPLVFDPHRIDTQPDCIETMLIKAVFVGSNPMVEVAGEGLLDYKCNYFLGDDPSRWRTDVSNYSAIVYEDIYPGINLRFYGEGMGQTAYEFVAEPWANLSHVDIAYEGDITASRDAGGRLVVTTAWGIAIDAIQSPEVGGSATSPATYVTDSGSRFKSRGQSRGVTLVYSTYLGGSGVDEGYSIVVDGFGCAYVTGRTFSADFPTQNAYDASYNGYFDVFVNKLSSIGSSLVYSTFLGGSDEDFAYGIVVDNLGCPCVVGSTASVNFPTVNAYDASYNGQYDAFVTRLSAAGNTLLYSTFLGGYNNDEGESIAIDSARCAYITGSTESSDFPMEAAYDDTYNGGGDVFVTKLSSLGGALEYSTYLGGFGLDAVSCIAVDQVGCAYTAGWIGYPGFPTHNAHDTSWNGGQDVFVTKLSSSGNALDYSTYLGGSGDDYGDGIAVDGSGIAYLVGGTSSSDFPTQNAYDASNNGNLDAFITRLSSSGMVLEYSTFLGGSSSDRGRSIAIDGHGHAYVIVLTNSLDFPVLNGYDWSYNGVWDACVSELSALGNSLGYSTYLGGSDWDEGRAIAVDDSACAYVTGLTGSADFPTYNGYDANLGGGRDAFVTKLSCPICCCLLRGDIDHNGTGPDIADLVYLVQYMFDGGPEPPCLAEADVNGDGTGPDIADLVYLVTYMFGGSPAPVPCP